MNLSNISSSRIGPEERSKNLSFIWTLYSLFAVELIVAIIWTSFALSYYDKFGSGIVDCWWVAIVTGSICLILILLTLFLNSLRNPPYNLVIYSIFILCFMHFVSYLCVCDSSYLVYYCLWLLLGIALGFSLYAWSTKTYMHALFSLNAVVISSLLIFVIFLIFTEIDFLGLLLVLIVTMIIGFYLNYDVRRMIRGGLYDYGDDDPWTGAVRIWAEGVLVFCRFFELLGRGCCKNKD